MRQARLDSLMEAVVNTIIGLGVSIAANQVILPLTLGVSPSLAENVMISLAFTIISVARSYTLRRVFNGRTPWQTMKTSWNARSATASASSTNT